MIKRICPYDQMNIYIYIHTTAHIRLNSNMIIVTAHNNDEQYIKSKRERSKERHRFNVVRQFTYVYRKTAIILIIIQVYINEIYI
jgi:hypothetical protein